MSANPDLPNIGYIYIMSNPIFQSDIRKIGCTFGSKSPSDRAVELYKTAGIPQEFTVEKWFFVEDSELVEQLVHNRLDHVSVNKDKEFFRISLEDAVSAIQQAQRDVQSQIWAGSYVPNITHKSISGLKEQENSRPAIASKPYVAREPKAEQPQQEKVQEKSSLERLQEKGGAPLALGNTYKNPKFPKMLLLLAKASATGNKSLYSIERLAKELEISPQGVEKLMQMAQAQKFALIFEGNKQYENRYGINIQVKKSLSLLKDSFPECDFSEFESFLIDTTPEPKKRVATSFIPRSQTNDYRAVAPEEDIFSQLGELTKDVETTISRKPRP